MELHRPGKESNRIALFALLLAGLAAWNIRDGLRDGGPWIAGLGVFFAAWAVFLTLTLVRRSVMARISEAQVDMQYITHTKSIPWDQIRWARLDPEGRAGLIAYRRPGDRRDRLAPFSIRAMGRDNTVALRDAVLAARPDLPDNAAAARTRGPGDTKGDSA
ncbi:hypothetical protein DQW77_07195 [Roseovarius sp. TE539]|nr:hypothetical protein DQW77_07195 [Roseovarius sp. TE539]